jgi:aldehyde:ferredoxin oxidoreductase
MAGERIWNLERIFNIKAGYTREDDTLPTRFFEGKDAINRREFEEALEEYYQIRGWNSSGKPTKEKMRKLGL